jgi:7-cyano-7-deazaguanine synthase in queuosine biosynthesis
MSRVVLLNSGGIDSRVAAAMLVASGMEPHSLTLDWNPVARDRVLAAAQTTADAYCASHLVFAYPVDWMLHSDKLGRPRMPYTVHVAVALGAQYALHVDTLYVATGGRKVSVRNPATWHENMQSALNQSRLSPELIVLTPVFELGDSAVTAKAAELGVDLTTTWSCSLDPACGTCVSCLRREREGVPS